MLTRRLSATPFVPQNERERAQRCEEIFRIAALGLKKRIEHTGAKHLVIGVSGGLDSTLALMIAARAVDLLGLPRETLIAVSMPCFGTTARTKSNSEILADELRAERRTIPISSAVRQHFADIGHNENNRNVVYENAQARERTLRARWERCRKGSSGEARLPEIWRGSARLEFPLYFFTWLMYDKKEEYFCIQ